MTKSSLVNLMPPASPAPDCAFPRLEPVDKGFRYSFYAMASPCELRIDCHSEAVALRAGQIACTEALRIEHIYSRYLEGSIISQINSSEGEAVEVDGETAKLLDFAAQCHAISDGLFDITSGVLRRIWRFDGSDRLPTEAAIRALRPLIGWKNIFWKSPLIILPKGMEIDFGGLGKEYAVDCALLKVQTFTHAPVLVNFGGDLRVSGPRADGSHWRVAISSVDQPGQREGMLDISSGALTTSGDASRFLLKDGVRYSHIIDPRTARPVKNPPSSVTVAAPSCIEAGLVSTLAMLHGRNAEIFLKREGVQAWVVRQ